MPRPPCKGPTRNSNSTTLIDQCGCSAFHIIRLFGQMLGAFLRTDAGCSNVRFGCAPCKGGAFQWADLHPGAIIRLANREWEQAEGISGQNCIAGREVIEA